MTCKLREVGLTKMDEMKIAKLKSRADGRKKREQRELHDEFFEHLEKQGRGENPLSNILTNENNLPQPSFRTIVNECY